MDKFNQSNTNELERFTRLMVERKKIWNSRKEFGAVLGISPRNVENWESGKAEFPVSILETIYKNGGDIIYILTGERQQATGTDGPAAPISERDLLLAQLNELKQDKQNLIADKEALKADKEKLTEQLDKALTTIEDLRALYEEFQSLKTTAALTTDRARKSPKTNNKASS